MTTTLHVFAPAKLNLFLHILGKNQNGYHRLQTIFQLIDLGDTLTFESTNNKEIKCIAPNCTFPMEENLVYRAAKLLQQHYHCYDKGVTIYLNKFLPTGAGLGGGSSNAGATLRTLNQLWQINASTTELMALAVQLGADVPIFVLNQNAWAEGIGEQLTPISLPAQDYVILNPRCPISTQALYQHPDLPRNTTAISMNDYSFAHSKNDFEELACRLYPEISAARDWLKQFGSARLTGSGCCLFLPIPNQSLGEIIKQQAPPQWDIMICKSLFKIC